MVERGILSVSNLTRRYGAVAAVDGISFDLHKGEVLTLLGHSGCGKSTTLRMAAGLDEPDAGEITLRGAVVAAPARRVFVPAERRNIGLVFQSYAVWPHMTVGENIAYPLEVRKMGAAAIRDRVDAVADIVGLGGYVDRPATQLSGGQQQRVALARALVYEPDVLLLDEPFSNLDAKLREEMRDQLRLLQHRLGTTILYVTHDQTEAMSLSHRVAVMRAGVIEQLAPPHEIYENPASFFVQDFVGRTVVLSGRVETRNGATALVRLVDAPGVAIPVRSDLPAGAAVRLACRPEDIAVVAGAAADGTIAAKVVDVSYGGDHYDCGVEAAGTTIALRLDKRIAPVAGGTLSLTLDPAKVKAWPG